MAKMRGFLHSKPKIDDAEWELAQSRTAERLAGLFSDAALDGLEEPEPPAVERPPIVVSPPEAVEAEATTLESEVPAANAEVAVVEPVGVMAQAGEHFDENGWQLPSPPADAKPAGLPRPVKRAATKAAATVPAATKPARPRAKTAAPASKVVGKPALSPPSARASRATTARSRRKAVARAIPAAIAHCPYCAVVLAPAPTASRRCERCRQRIMVKRVDGQPVYLTEGAVAVFEAENRRAASAARLGRERARWLALAAAVDAPERRQAQLTSARLSEETVAASKALYLSSVDRAFRAARKTKDWDLAARYRRDQATALYRAAGSPKPPAPDIVVLYRDGVAAELRGIAEISRDAELVAAACCEACRGDDHKIFRISTELRQPRLPHAGCPRGLCRCHWDLAARDRTTMRRYLRRRPAGENRPSADEVPTPA